MASHTLDHISGHIVKYNDLINNSRDWTKIVQILLDNCEINDIRKLNIAAKADNCGILIILNKEDIKIESLLKAKPETLKNYKIMTIQSYENQENGTFLIKNEFHLPSTDMVTRILTNIDLDDFQ